jgi:hypothetical protein
MSLLWKTLPFDALTIEIWSKVVQRLTHVQDGERHSCRYLEDPFSGESAIAKTIPKIINEVRGKEWKFAFQLPKTRMLQNCEPSIDWQVIAARLLSAFIFGDAEPIRQDDQHTSPIDFPFAGAERPKT